MGWAAIKTVLLELWAGASGPGLTLGAGLCAGVVSVWLVMNWRYGEVVSLLRARLKHAEDQIGAFETAFAGLTPAQAGARLRRLEALLAATPPRRLDDEQKRAIAQAVGPPFDAPYLTIVYDDTSAEADRYAHDFMEAFAAAPGWNVLDERYPKLPNAPPLGVAVGLADPDHPRPTEQLVLAALRDAGVAYDVLPKTPCGGDAEIVVGAR